MVRVTISGFGRIGRNFLRAVMQDKKALSSLQIVAINIGPARLENVAHMMKYDTLMGIYPGTVRLEGSTLVVDDQRIAIVSALDPEKLPWKQLAIDWVVEASGKFTSREGASKHLTAGAKKVLITSPAKNEDVSIIPGVNDAAYDAKKHHIVSLGSCTTNAFLTMLKVLHDEFSVQRGFMTTIHAYTNTQVLLDVESGDPRRARAAALNIIPTSTGAMDMLDKVMPALQGCIEAVSIRVPVAKVSLIDFTFIAQKKVTAQSINQAFTRAAQGSMKGILALTMEPLVSSDFSADNHSVVIDGLMTGVTGDTMGKVFGWYDNEWGYSVRLKDFLLRTAK